MEANLAVLIDFENIAAGTEKEGLGRFDIDALMKRLKDKGRILVARSYGDWGRFARFKQSLLTNNVTMMELTSHGMQDKNRADIAMVVDCLELAFTRAYIDTFVVVSGDSDFTPLVLKMRELNKRVIGCGTRSSTSRLLVQACDEFLFYDNIVKEARAVPVQSPDAPRNDEAAFALLVDALEGVQRENPEPCHASIVKTALLRKSPDFSESELGYGSFARFLESAAEAGYVKLSRDQKGGGYRVDSAEAPDGAPSATPSADIVRDANWTDSYLPDGSAPFVERLAKAGLHPLAHPTRMAILQAAEESVNERKKRRRRITVPFVQDDVKKRMQKARPDLPGRAIRSVFDALIAAGLLVHKDGKAIRSPSATFAFDRDADKLNAALVPTYLGALRDAGADLSDAGLLAALFLGNADRKREIEEALAWAAAHRNERPDDATDERPASSPRSISASEIDDLLFAEDAPAAPVADEVDLDAVLTAEPAPAPAEPLATEPIAVDEAPKTPRRRRTRRPRGKGEAQLDLDGALGEE